MTFDIVLQKQRGEVYTIDQLNEIRQKECEQREKDHEQWKRDYISHHPILHKIIKS